MELLLICHVEPGTVRSRTLVFDPAREEGVVRALPSIVEFAEGEDVRIAFAMTAAALAWSEMDLDGFEVGLHLHPQDLVLKDRLRGTVRLVSDCLAHYGETDQRSLVQTSTEVFRDRQNTDPSLFVAGRWSQNETLLQILIEAGFTHDGSVLPGLRNPCAAWERVQRMAQPYRPSAEDRQGQGSLEYVYVPVHQGLLGHYLTPETIHLLGVPYFKATLKEAQIGGAEVVHVYFHSPMALDSFFLSEFSRVIAYARDRLRASFPRVQSVTPPAGPGPRPFPPVYLRALGPRFAKSLLGRGKLGEKLLGTAWNGESPSTWPDWVP